MSPLSLPTDLTTQLPINNPLTALANDGYNVKSFTYPIDLANDPGESHMVVFYINEQTQTGFPTVNPTNFTYNSNTGVTFNNNNPTGVSRYNINGGTGGGSNTPTSNDQASNISTYNSAPINRVATTIALYIPPVVQTSYNTTWGTADLNATGAALKAVKQGDYVRAITEGLAGTVAGLLQSITSTLASKAGVSFDTESAISAGAHIVRNPNTELLFQGIGFREYQFDFKFTPRSEQEAIHVQNIIKAFKFYASPEIKVDKILPRYYIWPAEFDIEFWSNGKLNTFINKIATCACTSVSVNYTGSGQWSALRPGNINGMSVETNLTLRFKELEIITKNRVSQGF
jgi:hypothetical protein